MNDFIFFLGRFHVLVLHLPIGILLLSVVLDVMSRQPRYAHLDQTLPLLWAAAAITASTTVVLGLLHFAEGGFEGAAASAHRNYGIGVAVASIAVWLLVTRMRTLYLQTRSLRNALLVFLIIMTGHYGGNLTHGSTYLVEYAPAPLRALTGHQAPRSALTDVVQADPWHDVVGPLLQARCQNCHNADKRRGQLNLASLDAVLAGGKNGAVVVPGDAAGSELYRRITLPENHQDVMPAEGKAALSARQVQILGWWIDAGLPADTTISGLVVEPAITELLAAELGLDTATQASESATYPEIPQQTLAALFSEGWLVRLQSQESRGLLVSRPSPGQQISAGMLDALAAAAPAIVELNLASSGMNDELLGHLQSMPVLDTLHLGNNHITDAGVALLGRFAAIRVLNLHGNPGITDSGLEQLAGLESLERLYLWQTATSTAGIDALSAALPGLTAQTGSDLPTVRVAE